MQRVHLQGVHAVRVVRGQPHWCVVWALHEQHIYVSDWLTGQSSRLINAWLFHCTTQCWVVAHHQVFTAAAEDSKVKSHA